MVDADTAGGTKGDAREEGAHAVFDLDFAADGVGGTIRIFSYEMSSDANRRYETLVELFIRNDLEFSVDEEIPTDIVKFWDAVDLRGAPASGEGAGRLVAGCVLALREGAFIIDGIAAEPEYRAHKLGKRLLAFAVDETKARGGRELFLVARAPEFFRKQGFVTVPRAGAPTFFECFTCPQYNVRCFPEVMRLTW